MRSGEGRESLGRDFFCIYVFLYVKELRNCVLFFYREPIFHGDGTIGLRRAGDNFQRTVKR